MSKVNGSFPTGLDALLQRDARAKQYYSALPSYVQDLVHRGGERIQTAGRAGTLRGEHPRGAVQITVWRRWP